jgi:hypothetical protein
VCSPFILEYRLFHSTCKNLEHKLRYYTHRTKSLFPPRNIQLHESTTRHTLTKLTNLTTIDTNTTCYWSVLGALLTETRRTKLLPKPLFLRHLFCARTNSHLSIATISYQRRDNTRMHVKFDSSSYQNQTKRNASFAQQKRNVIEVEYSDMG